ncbi:hypothetical protein K0U83_16945 [bacterium]|nr:hypothetical protein [bacterium]
MVAENPPKLWAYLAPAAERDGAHGATGLRVFANGEERCAIEGRAIAGSYHLDGRVSPVQVYLREDIASADVASLAATWGALQAKHEAEVTALLVRVAEEESAKRKALRDLDALRLERDAVAREGWRACVLGVSIIRFWQAEAKSRSGDQRGALVLMNEAVALRDIFTAEDKAAGTGVG